MRYYYKAILLSVFFLSLCSCKKSITKSSYGHAVVSAKIEATQAGIKVLKMGGNAFDAMIATDLALAVVYPNAGNIGGGGFMVYRAKNSKYGSLDFREKAPMASTKNMFLDNNGEIINLQSSEGVLSIGVPGTISGLFAVYRKFGSIPLDSIFEPALKLAKKGFKLTKRQAKLFNENKNKILLNSDSAYIFQKKFKEGDVFKNIEFYKTLKLILENGEAAFYNGKISDEIINYTSNKGGILTKEDFIKYKPVWRTPYTFKFNDLKITTMGLPSSGGILLHQILKSIELSSIKKFKKRDLNYIKTLLELEKLSFSDRSKFLGDPDFYNTDFIDSITSEKYLLNRINLIDIKNPKPSKDIFPGKMILNESNETTHYSILDKYGNAISVTTTLNSNFGSKIFIPSLGFFLNNEMDDFSIKPGHPNIYGMIGGEINSIEPEKRMLSSMTPTIIEKNNKLSMILGSPGGPTIITTVLQTILNVNLFDDNLTDAVKRPRFHHLWLPDKVYFEKGAFSKSNIDSLKKIGYSLNKKPSLIGRVNAISINSEGKITATADFRGDDFAFSE